MRETTMATTQHQSQTSDVEIAYGDTFRHAITGEKRVVQDVREDSERVVWASGGWDYKDELVAAVTDGASLYEVEQRHDEWEATPY
jgi:hypothetical protein